MYWLNQNLNLRETEVCVISKGNEKLADEAFIPNGNGTERNGISLVGKEETEEEEDAKDATQP